MAERRMLSKSISVSEKVNSLPDIFDMLLYTWMIPHADDYGRLTGSPMKVRALVVPMIDKTIKDVETSLQHMHENGLIVWYEMDGEKYIQIVNFESHQTGLHKRSAPKIPPPPGHDEEIQKKSGNENDVSDSFPEIPGNSQKFRLNRIEGKGREEEGKRKEEEKEGKGREESSGIRRNASPLPPPPPLPSSPTPSEDEEDLISDYERDIMRELWKVENYPADEQKDLALIRALAEEYPTVELLLEARKWRTYKLDKPLIPGKHNARSQFRTWVQKEAKWQKERDEREEEDEPDYIPPYWQKWEPPEGEEVGN